MTREDTVKMLAVMKVAYPKFYVDLKPTDAETAVNLWHTVLQQYPPEVVNAAVQQVIRESPFAPTLADVCKRIDAMQSVLSDAPTPEALWARIAKAASNGFYGSEEEYKALPPICQRFVGSASALRAMAMMEDDTFHSVTRGQFLRLAKGAMEREDTLQKIPDHVRLLLEKADLARIEEGEK